MDGKASDSIVTAIGIDIGKNTFHLVGRLGRMACPCREEPLGVTAELGYSLPTQSSTTEIEDGAIVKVHNPQFLIWDGSVQYSMPYLKEKVADLGLPIS
jgi:hypothetical protein